MHKRLLEIWRHLSLEHQFLLAGLLVLVCLMGAIGSWVSYEIEAKVTNQTAATTALFVNSVVTPLVQELADGDQLTSASMAELERLLNNAPLGEEIVALKVWGPGGRVLYSSNPDTIGVIYPVSESLALAWKGDVNSHVSDLGEEEHATEKQFGQQLLETYSPVRLKGSDRIIAVAEFYQTVDMLAASLSSARSETWLIVGLATVTSILLLAAIVRPGSETIARQQRELTDRLARLSEAMAENKKLHDRVRRAAVRTVASNESSLRRISADLHDGPAQSLALALLRLDTVLMHISSCDCSVSTLPQAAEDIVLIQDTLNSTMQEMRSIAAGLVLPELAELSVEDTVGRVVSAHEKRAGDQVDVLVESAPEQSSLTLKFTLYRVIQEALSNGHRHGGSVRQSVRITNEGDVLVAEISDHGAGFEVTEILASDEHLGLAGMRERVESMGGEFWVDSSLEQGTRIGARMPLTAAFDG